MTFLYVLGLTILPSPSAGTFPRSRPIFFGASTPAFFPLANGATTLTLVGSDAGKAGLNAGSEETAVDFLAALASLLLSVLTFSNSSSELLNPSTCFEPVSLLTFFSYMKIGYLFL